MKPGYRQWCAMLNEELGFIRKAENQKRLAKAKKIRDAKLKGKKMRKFNHGTLPPLDTSKSLWGKR